LASLYTPLNNIFQTYGLVQSAKAGIRRAFEILESEQILREGRRLFAPKGARGKITFDQVSFGYHPSHPVLKKINFQITAGEKIAIVGSTGSGKSTLVSLLSRFYDPQNGRVLIDDVDVQQFQLRALRRQITMVLQPPWVFPVTISENIAYGCATATQEQIETAARQARIHDVIVKLPQGYETVLGEQGVTISEGEKQRLTIARAILRNSPIVILDEPTSSLDAQTESLIMEALETLLVDKTALIIAHRLSTVRWANRIIGLDNGAIAEEGSFAELLWKHGIFTSLYHAQFGGRKRVRDGAA
jgi:ATP-binding cassette subfamily B protein/subfamily B ATP-binding cassette protein MsbA